MSEFSSNEQSSDSVEVSINDSAAGKHRRRSASNVFVKSAREPRSQLFESVIDTDL